MFSFPSNCLDPNEIIIRPDPKTVSLTTQSRTRQEVFERVV